MRQLPVARGSSALLSALALAVFASAAHSATNLVANGSFENVSATTTTAFWTAGVANWSNSWDGETLAMPSWYTNGYLYPPNVSLAGNFPQTSPDGGNFVLSDADYHTSAITQTLTGLTPNAQYTLSFYQALAQDTEPYITTPGPVTGYWHVSLGSSSQDTPMMYADGAAWTYSPWKLQTMTFTAQNATEVLSFLAVGTGDPPMAGLDGVSLVADVPEPGSIWLLSGGFLLLGWKFRARQRALAARRQPAS
jgi:hypothetical protein